MSIRTRVRRWIEGEGRPRLGPGYVVRQSIISWVRTRRQSSVSKPSFPVCLAADVPKIQAGAKVTPAWPAERAEYDRHPAIPDWANVGCWWESNHQPSFTLELDGFLLGERGAVVLETGEAVPDFEDNVQIWPDEPLYQGREQAPRLAAPVASLCSIHTTNYYHWLFQILPRLEILRASGYTPENLPVVVPSNLAAYMRETLDLWRVAETVSMPAAGLRGRLIVPSIPPMNPSRRIIELLRERLQPDPDGPRLEKVFISRGPVSRRRLVNEAEIKADLEADGFVSVDVAKLSVRQQVSLFANAKVVVAVHGAALANLVFSEPGQRVVELMPKNYVFAHFALLAQARGLDHRILMGSEPRVPVVTHHWSQPGMYYRDDIADIEIDRNKLNDLVS